MNKIKENISGLIQGLSDELDYEYIEDLIENHGYATAARILGFNTNHYDYLQLAGRIAIKLLKDNLGNSLTDYLLRMKDILSPEIIGYYTVNLKKLQGILDERESLGDTNYDWGSANSLLKNYLTKTSYDNEQVIETPFQLFLRIAVSMYYNYRIITKSPRGENEYFFPVDNNGNIIQDCCNTKRLKLIKQTFLELCDQLFVPASPIIYNSGLISGQLASCFLLTGEDNTGSICDGMSNMAHISRNLGGMGFDVSRFRHSRIKNKGTSNGLVPWMYMYNSVIRAFNQGGKRKGACTMFCRPHHIDIYEFCEISWKEGDQYTRAHDLNTAIWFPWLFWERVKEDGDWTLMCPAESKELNDLWGIEWEQEYLKQEKILNNPDGYKRNRRIVKARHFLDHVVKSQLRSGMPYILHADAVNMKSNQKNLGYIRSANLCLEICEFTSNNEIANCNLSSVSLKAFVTRRYSKSLASQGSTDNPSEKEFKDCFDFQALGKITRHMVRNLNQVIDNNCYPLEETKISNLKHRPLGIGVSGFAEMLYALDLPIEVDGILNPVVKKLNKMIFACMYFNAMVESLKLAILHGPYETFKGSPLSEGKFQFDLWKEEFELLNKMGRIDKNIRTADDDIPIDPKEWGQSEISINSDIQVEPTWDSLRKLVMQYGVYNSLLLALMPTATSAQVLRNTETTEFPQSNIYSRKLLNTAYPILNESLTKELEKIGLWNKTTIQLLQADNGSISKLKLYLLDFPDRYPNFNDTDLNRLDHIISVYKTMVELSSKIFYQLAADRGRYICQSQSTNVYMKQATKTKLKALHQYGNRLGIKTGMYYLRLDSGIEPIKFTVDTTMIEYSKRKKKVECTEEVCMVCQ
jgi:ribonucleoside-diphosphate reductase alpha chain